MATKTPIMSTESETSYPWPTRPPVKVETNDKVDVVMTVGVPLVVMFLILLSLCMVLVYMKARQRAGGLSQQDPITAISGGVPMSTSAFSFINSVDNHCLRSQSNPSLMTTRTNMEILNKPPSYEDAMKELNINSARGIVNVSFSPSVPPPPYQPPANNNNSQTEDSSNTSNSTDTSLQSAT